MKLSSSPEIIWPDQWQQLAVMIDAGLSIDAALKTLKGAYKEVDQDLIKVISLVERGVRLSDAFLKTNVVSSMDFSVLNIAEKAGKLPLGLELISQRRRKWHQRVQSLKAMLWLPKLLLLVGAFAGLLIRTVSGKQEMVVALQSVTFTLLFFWFLINLSVWLIKQDSLLWLSIGWRLPVLKKKYRTYQLAFEQTFYRLFTWQIASGVAADLAMKNMQSLLSASSFKRSISSASKNLNSGINIETCLTEHGFVLTKPLQRVMLTSLHAGAWEKAVLHHLDWQKQTLESKADDFFKWLPRLYYVVALIAVSKFMFI